MEKSSAPFTLIIEGKNGLLGSAEGWKDGNQWTMKGTAQNGIYFSATNALVKDFWVGKKNFLPASVKK